MSFDEDIKNALKKKAEEVCPKDDFLVNIKEELYAERKVCGNMKFNKKALGIGLAALIAIVGASAAIASGGFRSTISSSSRLDDITEFPSAETVEEKVGYVPKYVDNLQGHKFERASISNTYDKDEEGSKVNKRKEIDFWYENDSEDGFLTLNTSPVVHEDEFLEEENNEVIEYGDVKFYYCSFVYKAVPPDYEVTKEELEAEERGELSIGYGSDEIYEKTTQYIKWNEDGITYDIMDMGAGIEKEDFINMAKQVTDSE